MDFDKNLISMKLEEVLSDRGAEGLVEDMYPFFIMWARDPRDRELVLVELKNAEASWTFDAKVCEDLKDWFSKVPESGGSLSLYKHFYWFGKVPKKDGESLPLYEDFKALMMSSQDLILLCFYLLHIIAREQDRETYQLSLKSSDGLVLKIEKSAATTNSVILNHVVDCTGGRDEIPVPVVHSTALSPVIWFCEMKRDFEKGLWNHVNRHKDLVTKFVNSNHDNFKDLHRASDFLYVPALLKLASRAMGDMGKGKSLEEISEWYGNWSISQTLSSLGLGVVEDAGENAHLEQAENPWVGEDAHLDQGENPWAFA